MASRLRNTFLVLLLFVFSYHIAHAASLKIPNYGTGGSGFSKTVTEKWSDLIFKKPKLGNKNSSVDNNPIYLPKTMNGSAVVIVSSCAGIQYKSSLDIKNWNALFLSNGFVTTVVNTTSYPRKNNCGRYKTQSPSRGVKDIFDAIKNTSKVEGVNINKIFVIGFSLGAMNAAKSIWTKNAKLALKEDEILPAAVAGLYGGCKYGNQITKRYLFPDLDRPILWLMGEDDKESPPTDCKVVKIIKEKNELSDYHTYKNATHCWDCEARHGFTKKVGNGNVVTYLYNEKATSDSKKRVLTFFDKIISTIE
jgi:dienelactone hydrolase